MKTIYLFIGLFICKFSFSQDITDKLDRAMSRLAGDEQFRHSILSMYVVDGKTGKVVYDKNGQVGLAPASCQKVVTSVSAFELLGKDYTYQTEFGYTGTISGDVLSGNLYIMGNGDPTFGSWRWKQNNEESVTERIIVELKKLNIQKAHDFIIDDTKWGTETIPNGWVWEDIGQYYGAYCNSFNWNENQYEISLKPGKKIGDSVTILYSGRFPNGGFINELTTAAEGTGDKVYVFRDPGSSIKILRGTAPLGMDTLKVLASVPDATSLFFDRVLYNVYKRTKLVAEFSSKYRNYSRGGDLGTSDGKTIFNFISPSLDSINYWFLKKSINLYGEAFVKTIAYEKTKVGSTDTGVNIIRDFWANKGIERSSLKIIDGSGLSPANRVTTAALVAILQYAKQRPWFSSFYYALPEMNGIKMKDGYIGGVRAYTGYVKSATGVEYSFSFIVNNFDGNPASAREKMWKVLDLLK